MSATTEPINVLHVDDEPDFADMVATFLEREDDRITVTAATSASEGLDQLTGGAGIDCIVSDYDMPGQNGIEFLQTVREAHPDLPFILYTGKGSEEVASDAISAGVTDYLQKESGSSQYTILANRITNAVKQYRAKQAIEANEKRLSLFFEQSPLGVIEWNEEFEVIRINETAEEILGYTERDLRGNSWEMIVPDADRESVAAVVSDLLDAEGGYHSINQNIRKDGEQIVCEWHNRVVTDDGGDVVAIYSQFQDITERKDRKRELKRYEAYLKESTDIITVLDESGTIKYESPALERILGYEPRALIGENGFDYIHPDDVDEVYATFTELVAEPGSTATVECRFRTADDEWRWLEVRGTNQLDHDAISGIVTNNRDITERKEREHELEQTNALLSTLIETLPVGVLAEDESRNVMAVNDRFLELFEIPGSPDDIIGADCERMAEDVSELFVEPEEFVARVDELVSERRSVRDEELLLRDGRTFSRSHEPIELPNEPGHLWVYRDVTAHRERERALEQRTDELEETTAELEEQYRHLFEEAPVMAVVTRAEDGRPIIEDCNQLFVETLGYDKEAVIGEDLASFYTPESQQRLLDEGGYERALAGNFVREDRELVAADGEIVETLLRAVPRRTAQDGTTGTLALYIDITERKKLERQKERLEAFTSIVSHDLRNPLNVAQGRVELADEECDSEHLDAAMRAHERMEVLIDDLLTLARSGDQIGDVEPVSIGSLTEACWENVSTAEATLVTDTDRSIQADRTRLQQLLENLMRNAVDHGGDGVTVTIGDLDGGFYLADDGPGIPVENRDEVFEAGYSTTDDGTGFGLAIVAEIVEAHDWEIRVTEGAEGGARFEITGVEGVE